MQALSIYPELPGPTLVRSLTPEGLVLPFPSGRKFVSATDILAMSGERNYTRFHFRNGRTLLYSKTLGEMLSRLPAHTFARIHRSHAVNRQHIHTSSSALVELVDGSEWAVSRRKKGNVVWAGPRSASSPSCRKDKF